MQQSTSKQVCCPINKNHLVTERTISTHCEKCSLKSAGYSPEDHFLSEPLSDSKCNIKLSAAKKIEVFSGARSMKSDFKSGKNSFIYAMVIELHKVQFSNIFCFLVKYLKIAPALCLYWEAGFIIIVFWDICIYLKHIWVLY